MIVVKSCCVAPGCKNLKKNVRWFKIVLPALLLLHSPTMYVHTCGCRTPSGLVGTFITFCLARSDLKAFALFREDVMNPFWICIIRRRKKLRVLSGGGNPWTSERWWTWNISWQMIIICTVHTKQSSYIKYLSYINVLERFQWGMV